MMRDLGVRMVFANSPQAKGRVERYNSTAQMRLPTDAVRFGVTSYDQFNAWFNEFYAPYLNSKLSHAPQNPASEFSALPASLDRAGCSAHGRRNSSGCTISYGGDVYMMAAADGAVLEVPHGTRLNVHVGAITEEMYVERSGRRWACARVAEREGRGSVGAQDRRDLQRLLSEMQAEGSVRKG